MRKGVFSTWGFRTVIVAVIAVVVGIALMGMFLGWIGAWDLNEILVEPVNQLIPAWFPLDVPSIFP